MGRVRRGEVWTVAGSIFASKPRPAVVLQGDVFEALDSVTVCPITSVDANSPIFRVAIAPTDDNGLRTTSFAMTDKLSTVRERHLRTRIGRLAVDDMKRLERAVVVFLSLGQ